ncbi:zinc finger CCHC domain-containing protein 9-like [Helianthus annuus]|uniref:zinc finger CCHC domain-containing protein 9-like n=1 Tax=Helianthus annuus TaxID=4232 RepID=UPI000B8FB936|nr:zinc finger CCHC domain-containing protein 9-like [Helianthus annuus]
METVVDISGCVEQDIVKFVSQSFKGEALVWWKALIQATGKVPLYNLSWDKFVDLMRETFCPQHEIEKAEADFLTLVMKNLDCPACVTSFNAMSRMVPYLITPEPKRIACFIGGLDPEVKGHVKASRPATYLSAVDLSLSLTLDIIRNKSVRTTDDGKRKRENDNSRRSDKKKKGNSEFKKSSNQSGDRPVCKNCKKRHHGKCTIDPRERPCGICKTKGHKALECKDLKNATCYGCNEKGHIKPNCPKNTKKPGEAKKTNARVFQMNAKEEVQNDNISPL